MSAAMHETFPNYRAVHDWLRKHHPRVGKCENCGKETPHTDHALKPGETYRKDRAAFDELCRSCHLRQDFGGTRTHCKNGHERVPETTRVYDGKSKCYLCQVERNRRVPPGSLRRMPRPLPRGRPRKQTSNDSPG